MRVTGFGVIEQTGQRLTYVTSGVIRTTDGDLPSRLGTIFEGVSALIRQHAPDQSAIEKVFVNVNPQSTLLLGQARGAAICGLVAGGVPVAEYTALQLKQAVVGYGRATKEQMQQMVVRLLEAAGRAGHRRRRCARHGDLPRPRRQHAQYAWRHRAGTRQEGSAREARTARGLSFTCRSRRPARTSEHWHSRFAAAVGYTRAFGHDLPAMIGRLTGILLEKNPPQLLLDVQGRRLRGRRADEHVLQPAAARRARRRCSRTSSCARTRICCSASAPTTSARAFRQLMKITGVGARTALAVLSGMSVAELAQAVTLQEAGRLTQGARHRQEDRRAPAARAQGQARRRHRRTPAGVTARRTRTADILQALLALGYSDKEARRRGQDVPAGIGVADGIKLALKALAKA